MPASVGNNDSPASVPAEPGLYEVRYVLDEGSKTLASTPVEVVGRADDLAGNRQGGDHVRRDVGETANPRDWVTIVPAGADEGAHPIPSVSVCHNYQPESLGRTGSVRGALRARRGQQDAGFSPIEIVAANAPLDDGAGGSAPATAALEKP